MFRSLSPREALSRWVLSRMSPFPTEGESRPCPLVPCGGVANPAFAHIREAPVPPSNFNQGDRSERAQPKPRSFLP